MSISLDDLPTVTLPIITVVPSRDQIADAIDEARRLIHANGIMVGHYFDRNQHDVHGVTKAGCRMDVRGAINMVTAGDPVLISHAPVDRYALCVATAAALESYLRATGETLRIPSWSDAHDADEVQAAMAAAAASLRGERA